MARSFQINGESMVAVKGNVNTAIASLTNLGLTDGDINVALNHKDEAMMVDAFGGGEVSVDQQVFLADATITMNLVHFDRTVLGYCLAESLAGGDGSGVEGIMPRTGTMMGGGNLRFAAGNHWIGLNIASPVGNIPWRFLYAKLTGTIGPYPLGTHKSIVQLTWLSTVYTVDPWGGGVGSLGAVLFDHTPDV